MGTANKPVALVTGAAAGIGKATAIAYAKAGCHVAISDVQTEKLAAVAKEIEALGVEVLADVHDVGNEAAVRRFHQQVGAKWGRLDYACNNAGIEGKQAETHEMDMETYDRVMNINVRGLFVCMQEQIKLMLPRGQGAIVNIASIAGLVGFPSMSPYCAAKGAVVQITRSVAVEYAERNIRVNAICPGVIKTDMVDRVTKQDPETEAAYAAFHPMNRMGTVAEVADSILFMSLPQSSFITGQALAVDGGMVAR
ncbi:MAG: SDR family oxidoreductase [Gammaproteobacteria bacterium]|nr:SDR family oxidoreductase [Gammaproteobacteria bacterium]